MSPLLLSLWAMSSGTPATVPDQWYPRHPDRLDPPLARHRWPWLLLGPISPIPNPAPPVDLTWLNYAPAFVVRTRWSPEGTSLLQIPIVAPVLPVLAWQRQSPDLLTYRRGLTTAEQSDQPFPFDFIVVPTTGSLSWLPRFPDQLLRRRQVPVGFSVVETSPTAPISVATCLEWTTETLTSPLLTGETLIAPTMASDTLVSPTLTGEDLC